jgi:hypothetical protein
MPKTDKQLVSSRTIKGKKIDSALAIQHCNSCEYAKATHKPIKKERQTPRATKLGDEVHSNVCRPSPIQTPGHKDYYMSFTDDHTRWTHLWLLATKDSVL